MDFQRVSGGSMRQGPQLQRHGHSQQQGSMQGRKVEEAGAGRACGGYVSLMAMMVCGLAVLVIGSMGVAGKLPVASLGRYAIGFGAVAAAGLFGMTQAIKPGLKKFSVIIAVMMAASYITLGALGLKGTLSAHKIAVGTLVTHFVGFALWMYGGCYDGCSAITKAANAAKAMGAASMGGDEPLEIIGRESSRGHDRAFSGDEGV
jgi:hypothetical protein